MTYRKRLVAVSKSTGEIVVSVDIWSDADNGSGDFDFASTGAGINVIGVAIQLF